MRKCRFCKQDIENASTVCEHCGKDLIPGRQTAPSEAAAPTPAATVAATTKLCPFCAEEIQFAAIVCKHCGRDLMAGPTVIAAAAKKTGPRWGRIALVVGVLLASPIALVYCGADHQRFLKFAEQRDAWHRRCDGYTDKAVGLNPIARACKEELEALTAYAKRQGWK
jgi:hypothetical protein